jgi:multiple sugar transport system substrate-binding protein
VTQLELSSMSNLQGINLVNFQNDRERRVRLQSFHWDNAWNELLQIGLFGKGPDVSEVGSTWLPSLADLKSLRPFRRYEVQAFGGNQAFFESSWAINEMAEEKKIWSIPFTSETRVIYYRKDILRKVGIEAEYAFSSPESLLKTLEAIHRKTDITPLCMATNVTVVHNMASWVWGAGGRYRSEDGRRLLLGEPQALQGILDFFKLNRYMPRQQRGYSAQNSDEYFIEGKAAVTISGYWVLPWLRSPGNPPIVQQNLGVAMTPGVPYVGGSSLVIWKHSPRMTEAVELVRFLTSAQSQRQVLENNSLPARVEVLRQAPYASDPLMKPFLESLHKGRPFNSSLRWSAIETRVNHMLFELWQEVLNNPGLELDRAITRRVKEMALNIDNTILVMTNE